MQPRILLFSALLALSLPALAAESPPKKAEPAKVSPDSTQVGSGDLLLSRARLTLDDRQRTASVTLFNNGSKENTYRLHLSNLHVREDGSYAEVDEKNPPLPNEKFADGMVVFSPRQVTLKSGASQQVKVQLRVPEGTPEGEYRSHLYFIGNPDKSKGINFEQKNGESKGVNIAIIPTFGVSIPVVVRVGNPTAIARIREAKIDGNKLRLVLERKGNRSLYGNITVEDASGTQVAAISNLSFYPPNETLVKEIPLLPGKTSVRAPLKVTYRQGKEEGEEVIAEAVFPATSAAVHVQPQKQ